jgi:anti-sigma factor RsiW
MQAPWQKRKTELRLSAYIDGELDEREAAEIGDHLVFDPSFCARLQHYEQVTALANAALAPAQPPDSSAFAARLVEALNADPDPCPSDPEPSTYNRLKPALLASAGILLTAGLTLAGLRRRNLI